MRAVEPALILWLRTGDARLQWLRDRSAASVDVGSRRWCGRKLGFLAGTLVKYKLLTGSTEFDELLDRDFGSSRVARMTMVW